LAEWLFEAGIGEHRAALVEDGVIVEAAIDRDGDALRVGAVLAARLISKGPPAIARVAAGEVMLPAVPRGLAEGGALLIAITREAIPERGRAKRAKAVPTEAAPMPGPDLLARIAATGLPVRRPLPHQPDAFEAAGWSELLSEAETGEIVFAGGALRLSPTPAMTLFDVDGTGAPGALALAAAPAIAAAIRRHGIGGSIGIDFPTLAGKEPRQAVAAALDAHLPPPFERTAVNGFGFLQIVRPRPRASLPEILRADPVGAAARAALRRLEREPPGGQRRHRLPAAVTERLLSRPDWLAELARRTGVAHELER
jgi:hypothetical protein